jgi:hypothetical protein
MYVLAGHEDVRPTLPQFTVPYRGAQGQKFKRLRQYRPVLRTLLTQLAWILHGTPECVVLIMYVLLLIIIPYRPDTCLLQMRSP